MLTYIDRPETRTVELIVDGKVMKDDYLKTAEHLQEKISEWGRINILEDIKKYDGFEVSVFGKNMKFAAEHLQNIAKCAVVADEPWIHGLTDAADPVVPIEVKAFPRELLPLAREWVRQ